MIKMSKKLVIVSALILLVILTISALTIFVIYNSSKNYSIKTTTNSVDNSVNNASYPVSNPAQSNTVISYPSYPVVSNQKTIEYTHQSGKFGYSYPDTWEFVPNREDMGLRPKAYAGFYKNEIVTILYFEDKGVNLRSQAMGYDGGLESEWIDVVIGNKTGIYYNYSSSNLNNEIYWFSNGTDAVKVMFRKYDNYAPDGHTDNSKYESDFNVILNSFIFY